MYDTEEIIEDLLTLFKNKFNDEINLINTKKNAVSGDDRFLETFDNDQYYFETIDKRILNHKTGFVMYGLVDTAPSQEQLGNNVENNIVTFQVALFDKGEKERHNLLYKLLRYRSAIKNLIKNNPEVFRGFAKPLVTGLKPSAFGYEKKILLSAGVDITASITSN